MANNTSDALRGAANALQQAANEIDNMQATINYLMDKTAELDELKQAHKKQQEFMNALTNLVASYNADIGRPW